MAVVDNLHNPAHYGKYRVIYADPPWQFACWSKKGMDRSAENHYGTMSFSALADMPINKIAASDAVLLLWAIDPLLNKAFELISSWGFTYKTVGFYWVKENLKGPGMFTGLGYWTRANPEQCLLATRGNPKRLAKDVRRLIISPRREHSRKPDETRVRIQRLLPGPYIELFARQRTPTWDCWGNEVR